MHKQNRDRFAKRLNGGVAIISAAVPATRTHNMEYTYRQNSNFYYLTGFEEPNSICVIAPNHPEHQFIMFVQPRDRDREIWVGKRVGIDGIIEDFGADAGFPISEFGEKIPDYINKTDRIYYTLDNEPLDQQIIGFIQQNRQTRSTKGIGPNTIIDPSEFFAEMRVTKIEEEILRIRRATEITADAHLAAMRVTRPEMYEYEIAAQIESIYHQAEQSYPGYKTILASGQNATILHYVDNNQQIKNNDLVLIDSGCEYKYYNGEQFVSGYCPFMSHLYFKSPDSCIHPGHFRLKCNWEEKCRAQHPYNHHGICHDDPLKIGQAYAILSHGPPVFQHDGIPGAARRGSNAADSRPIGNRKKDENCEIGDGFLVTAVFYKR